MGRQRRYYKTRTLYEISFRLRKGLPLVPTEYMKLILQSITARALELYPVDLCDDQWMSNHPHILVVSKNNFF